MGEKRGEIRAFPSNRQITAIDLYRAPLDGDSVTCYPLRTAENICAGN